MSLKINQLSVSHGLIVAVRDFSAVVEPGVVTAVIGPNGAGKTSLLSAIAGHVKHGGTIELDGTDIAKMPSHRRSRAGIGLVPSERGVFPTLSVRDHIRIAAGKRDKEVWEEIRKRFPIVGEKAASRGSDLSGGQQQLVSVARAMATSPAYILLDEPSIGLSPIAIGLLSDAIRSLAAHGVGVLLTEQNAGLALSVSDRCILMVRGDVRLAGTPVELQNRSEVEALYLGRSVGEKA
jgi:branched-chain amino acid transport system ATP-binding protein